MAKTGGIGQYYNASYGPGAGRTRPMHYPSEADRWGNAEDVLSVAMHKLRHLSSTGEPCHCPQCNMLGDMILTEWMPVLLRGRYGRKYEDELREIGARLVAGGLWDGEMNTVIPDSQQTTWTAASIQDISKEWRKTIDEQMKKMVKNIKA